VTFAFAWRVSSSELLRPTPEEIPALLTNPDVHVWVDLTDQSAASEALLTDAFGLHRLTVEDVFHTSQPKIERHDRYLYLIAHGVHPDHATPRDLRTVEVDIIMGHRWVVTHHDGKSRSVNEVRALVLENGHALRRGPAYLTHALLDHMVDHYLPLMDHFDQEMDTLEIDIFRNPRRELLEEIFDLKHGLQRLLRLGFHQREFLRQLHVGAVDAIPEDTRPFFRDVYDHFVRVMDLAESYRQLIDTALNAYLSIQSHRMNEVVKFLTIVSTVILPLTFVTGFYGMNFEHMPELHWHYGYVYVVGLLLVVGIGFRIWLRRRGSL
jgi:magnesium transporter